MFKTNDQAINWITNRRNLSKGIESYRRVMEIVGQPQDRIPAIHVAGTNGKGSTCNFIKDCLMEAGYKVGTFTSPHLVQHQDRIRINGEWISEECFLDLLNQLYSIIEKYELNMFEIDFLIACHYFINQKVDLMVIEVGLGGRLDCTNCLHHPLASIITSIGLDHMEILGDSKNKIAYEKSGIIKEGGLCIVGDVDLATMDVIKGVSKNKNARVVPTFDFLVVSENQFEVEKVRYQLQNKALYQMKNATLAITTLVTLAKEDKIKITTQQIMNGISKSSWAGRFETVQYNPLVILDGAHNEEGMDALIEAVKKCPKPWCFIFAALKDKPATNMIRKIEQNAEYIIATQFDFYRALPCRELKISEKVECIKDKEAAIKKGMRLVGKNGTLVLCGSLYFISDIREELINKGDM